MTALEDVAAERQRQIAIEGWDHSHDDSPVYAGGELAAAAACYAIIDTDAAGRKYSLVPQVIKDVWPFSKTWWKPKDRRRNLIRAAALLLAEIERLDRLEAKNRECAL